MQSKEFLKIKARKIAKQTWAGPGKFGVFIVICILIIATFESLGLSNRELNLEIRNVPMVAVHINLRSIDEKIDASVTEESHPKNLSLKEIQSSRRERETIIMLGAIDQLLYEGSRSINNIEQSIPHPEMAIQIQNDYLFVDF